MTIQTCVFKECKEIQKTRFAPYVGYILFIIASKSGNAIICDNEIITDYDIEDLDSIVKVNHTLVI